jgi:NAD(P)-dependent dehydrogenase (short-subunit alcohol dehydrogenase family)
MPPAAETTLTLAKRGAKVVVASRNENQFSEALSEMTDSFTAAAEHVSWIRLDLADMDSVASFVNDFKSTHSSLHILINCAGVMAIPELRTTKQGRYSGGKWWLC